MKFPRSLRQFDAFSKPLKNFRVQTVPGAIMTIFCLIIIVTLFMAELFDFMSHTMKQEIIVDISRDQKMFIQFDMLFHHVDCNTLSIDSMDISGAHQTSIKKEITKISVDTTGNNITVSKNISSQLSSNPTTLEIKMDKKICGSCYGANLIANSCCNTCEEVLEAYRLRSWVVIDVNSFEQCRKERVDNPTNNTGCRLIGHLEVNKVAGSFHIAPGKSYAQGQIHVHDLQAFAGIQFNLSHSINKLLFGESYPGQVNPLDNTHVATDTMSPMISYYLKLVPTLYLNLDGKMVTSNQYSVTWHQQPSRLSGATEGVPGVFFNYEISPLLVKLTEEHKSLLHFLTNTCAIIGGMFTVASLIDSFIYKSFCMFEKMK